MTDSVTHHSMDQELKQFALGGFPGSPRRLLRSHLLSPLRSAGCVSPLLLLSFPLPPVPLPCSTFLLFVLSLPALPVPDASSPSLEGEEAPPSPSLCLAHFLVELPFTSPARRSEVGTAEGGGGGAGGLSGGIGPAHPDVPPHSCCIPLEDKDTARLLFGLNRGLGRLQPGSHSSAAAAPAAASPSLTNPEATVSTHRAAGSPLILKKKKEGGKNRTLGS